MFGRNKDKNGGMGRGRGMRRGMGKGRRMGRGMGLGEGRSGVNVQEAYPNQHEFQQPTEEPVNREQELSMLKEHLKIAETQMNEITGKIRSFEGSETDSEMVAVVDPEKCSSCFLCQSSCPNAAIGRDEGVAFIDRRYCDGCGVCIKECPQEAISLQKR